MLVSNAKIPKDVDTEMKNSAPDESAPAGVSIRMGPVTGEMEVDEPAANGKRKTRTPSQAVNYAEAEAASASESEEDDKPIVRPLLRRPLPSVTLAYSLL